MKKLLLLLFALLATTLLLTSCNSKGKNEGNSEIANHEVLASGILTAEERALLTPDDVLEILKKGNKDFTEDNLTVRNNSARVREAALGQYPKAAILSCLDSRVPVEDIFHRGIGDVFVARVAGNFVNEDILGSLEYACKVAGAKLIVVLGHEHCGAIKSAIDDVQLGNITAMLSKIKPAVADAAASFEGEETSSNPEFVDAVCTHNIEHAINEIRAKSPILKEMEDKGEIKIVGGVYHLETGAVSFL